VADLLLEKAQLLLPVTTAAVFFADESGEEIKVGSAAGLFTSLVDDLTMKVGEGLSGWVVMHGQTALNEPAANDLARRMEPGKTLELNSALSAPLQVGGACIGAITLYHTGYSIYTAHHLRQLITLADHASSALDTISRLKTNEHLAHTDSLTNLPNARFIIQLLEDMSKQDSEPFTVLMLDLNGFKKINDTAGHLAGDQILRDTADILRQATRAEDIVGRYAGDEFVIVCKGRKGRDAYMISERIQKLFSDYCEARGGEINLSASIGLASFPEDGSDWRTLFSTADRRMYRDKMNFYEIHSEMARHQAEIKIT
jgi:diguanylate cyclase (GGDEF)-like protein